MVKGIAVTDKQHPELGVLLEYSRESTKAEFSAVRIHIIDCDECKQQLDQIQVLKTLTLSANPERDRHAEGLTTEEIAAYVDGELNEDEANNIAKLIQSDQQVKAATLHYALHSQRMRDSGVFPATETSIEHENKKDLEKISLFENIKQLINWQMPAWITVPVMVILLVTVVLQNQQPEIPQVIIASYQDEAVIVYKDISSTAPGIGFFSESRTRKKPFGGINVSWEENDKLEISWQAISLAEQYTLTLFNVLPSGLTEIVTKNTAQTFVHFDNLHLESNKRYQWLISGVTKDNKTFEIQGGFVVKKVVLGFNE